MAADGSLKFDTKINTEGLDAGISNLTNAIERLISKLDKITVTSEKAFVTTGNSAVQASRDIDKVANSAQKAESEMEQLAQDRAAEFTGTINFNIPEPSSLPGGNYDIYGNNVDEAIERNRQLEASARQTASTIQAEAEREERSIVGFRDSLLAALGVFRRLPSAVAGLFQNTGREIERNRRSARNLQGEIDRYTDALHYAERAGFGIGDRTYDEAYAGLMRARRSADDYRRSLTGVENNQRKVKKSSRSMSNTLKRTDKSIMPLSKSILKLSSMFKLMVIRMAMRTVIQGVQEGFQNLAQYSDETNRSISMLLSALTRFKNSFATAFAPILTVAAPALKSLINLLSEAATWAGQLMAALSGKSTFVKAVDVEEDYAASLKDSNKELKEKEKLTLAFDDLIQASGKNEEGYKPPTPDQMFETVEIEKDIVSFAETVKKVLSGLFDPLKESWNKHGSVAIESAKAAFRSIQSLAKSVGETFLQVWDTEKYGERITSDLVITFTNFMQIISNLASCFDLAWKNGDNGTNILKHLGDIVLEITGFFREASESIKNWSATLDFSPLLKSLDGVLVKLTPIVNKVGKSLLWLLNDILLPLGKWALEKVIPVSLDLISACLSVLDSTLDALQPLADWLWKDFIQPFGKWTGNVIIEAIKKITAVLLGFSDWVNRNQTVIENVTIAVVSFFIAWKFVEFVNGIKDMINILPRLIGNFVNLLGSINPLIIAVGAIISLAAILAKNWNAMTPTEKMISGILAAASAVGILAVALGAVKGAAAAGIIAAALAAGIMAATVAVNAGKRQTAMMQSSGGYSLQSVGNVSGYRMPMLATGTVIPPRAGIRPVLVGDSPETEIISPESKMKQAFKEALEEMGGIGGGYGKNVQVDMYVGEQKFATTVFNLYNKEKQRVGVRMVPEG